MSNYSDYLWSVHVSNSCTLYGKRNMNTQTEHLMDVSGDFVTINNERYYAIKHVDKIDPFFISLISNSDHWMFISSNGALTAGRVSPETALFPYDCVDKIYDSAANAGSKTVIRVSKDTQSHNWEPFNSEQSQLYSIERNLYKNTLGNKLIFEEINHDLNLSFRYSWQSSDKFGFVRSSEISNIGNTKTCLEFVDGIQNILPAGTPKFTQTISSNLVDAYKWNELDDKDGLGLFTLYSAITDRAEPCESLKANTVFCLGLEAPITLLSKKQLNGFKNGLTLTTENYTRGIRGAYFVSQALTLKSGEKNDWLIVANIEQDQNQITALKNSLNTKTSLLNEVNDSIAKGDDELARILASADGFQLVAEENVGVHHYANTLFNVLRGGIFSDQYLVSRSDLMATIQHFNNKVYEQSLSFLSELPNKLTVSQLMQELNRLNEPQLSRLCNEYLPIYFGRRHGDPSRPWNQFVIKLKNEKQEPLLNYQGNWRDIFQNWESLAYSYPEYIEGMIAKFVNASTMDGYNPYRITKEGIDWEVEEPDDPWSYIGYWGDHQIIYLLKLLEVSKQFHPHKLMQLLQAKTYCYANVPYKIKPFEDLIVDAKNTVEFDEHLGQKIALRTEQIGADGKLVLDKNGQVYQVNLLEKLLVPLLSKLGNLVIDGGIWLNTQRPEWNDANNALVGQGLSMVTLNYMRRYVVFMQDLMTQLESDTEISNEVANWLNDTLDALDVLVPQLEGKVLSAEARFSSLAFLGEASSRYRVQVYKQDGFSGLTSVSVDSIRTLLDHSLLAIEHTISTNKRADGLHHAYNLLNLSDNHAEISHLSPMLEGQVAALSSGALSTAECVDVVNALFASDVYRDDQKTFMLYPDKAQTEFMQKNVVDKTSTMQIESLAGMLNSGENALVSKDANDNIRFHADLKNKGDVATRISSLSKQYPLLSKDSEAIFALYEKTFNHLAFTGRSGGMFGFEGLGSVYWHMVSKLLLALGENAQAACNNNEPAADLNTICQQYYRVREGIGFNKTPKEYGAFPTDPYSHTPKHAGAQQPGMTGQVKEELIARFIELGIQVENGEAAIKPFLLRKQEFLGEPIDFRYLDVNNNWQSIAVDSNELAFTWCQVPFVYRLSHAGAVGIEIKLEDKSLVSTQTMTLDAEYAAHLFSRTGKVTQVNVNIDPATLFWHQKD